MEKELAQDRLLQVSASLSCMGGGGGTPYIQMIGMIVFFRGCNRRFGIFQGLFKQNPLKR